MAEEKAKFDAVENEQRKRMFETLFDGDEIDGKFYGLERLVTGIDASTAAYLLSTGRLAEIDSVRADQLKELAKGDKDGKPAEETPEEKAQREQREADEAADRERLATAKADFEAGRIPDDLIDAAKPADAPDRLVTAAQLATLAQTAGIEAKGSKADVAQAIMAARAKATGNT